MRLRPIAILNHPDWTLKILSPKADKNIVMQRSYLQLVTRQAVPPARAKHLLGMTQ